MKTRENKFSLDKHNEIDLKQWSIEQALRFPPTTIEGKDTEYLKEAITIYNWVKK